MTCSPQRHPTRTPILAKRPSQRSLKGRHSTQQERILHSKLVSQTSKIKKFLG